VSFVKFKQNLYLNKRNPACLWGFWRQWKYSTN